MEKRGLKKWVAHYEEWQGSGQTQASYCESKGLSLADFKWRISEASKKGKIKRSGAGIAVTRSPFVKASVAGERAEPVTGYCEIVFMGKHRVRIDSAEGMRYFRELLG